MSASPVGLGQKLRIGVAAVLLFVLAALFALGLPLVLVWPLWVAGGLALAALVLSLPVFGLRRLFSRGDPGYRAGASFAFIFAVVFAVLVVAAAFPLYAFAYLVDSRPTVLPLVTLTDGAKTVKFQGMQHVGSEGFYKSVVYDLREALDDGYVLFYEGVQPVAGRPDLEEWFNRFATDGASDLSGSYKSMADVCGLKFQLDYFAGLGKEMQQDPARHVAADVNYLEMKTEFERLSADEPGFADAYKAETQAKGAAGGAGKILDSIMSFGQSGSDPQRRLIGLACRGFVNYALGAHGGKHSAKDRVVLDFRNLHLAKRIADAPQMKIYITYGADHLPGLIADLKALDPAWRVVDVKWARGMANPEDLSGRLAQSAPSDTGAP